MRVVGGRLRGRPLASPSTASIRPTSDRVRGAIFNILEHAYGDPVPGARVLDLFAGTGAMGIEALSRGAAYALLVDDSATARALIRENIDALGLAGTSRLFRRDATRLGESGTAGAFSLVFCDPPYGKDLGRKALQSARDGGWLAPETLVVLEERAAAAELPAGFALLERRTYGETEIAILRAQAEA